MLSGTGDGKYALLASSQYNTQMAPEQSQIDSQTAGGKTGAWGPTGADVKTPWIQVRI